MLGGREEEDDDENEEIDAEGDDDSESRPPRKARCKFVILIILIVSSRMLSRNEIRIPLEESGTDKTGAEHKSTFLKTTQAASATAIKQNKKARLGTKKFMTREDHNTPRSRVSAGTFINPKF